MPEEKIHEAMAGMSSLNFGTNLLLMIERCQKTGIGDANTIRRIVQELELHSDQQTKKLEKEIERLKKLIDLQQKVISVMNIPHNLSDSDNTQYLLYRGYNGNLQQFKTENKL